MENLEKEVKLILWDEYAYNNVEYGDMERYGIESIEINDTFTMTVGSPNDGERRKGKGVIVHITATRPGLLIGRKGLSINNVTKVLKNKFGKDSTLTILESKMWRNLFSN